MSKFYSRNEDGSVTLVSDVVTWARGQEHHRHIAESTVGDAWVSTVFLGIDHNFSGIGPPILWETMVFGGPHDQKTFRYASEGAAIENHEAVVKALTKNKPLPKRSRSV